MAFFDDMINGIRGIFGGDNKPQAQKSSTNVAKGATGVFSSATQNANPLDEEEKRRREAERAAAEEARRREEEERKAREEEERRKAEEERKRQAEAERQRAEAERQKRVEQYKAMTSRGEFNAQNEYNRQFETLRKEKLKQLEDSNGWFNNAFDGAGKQREELAKNQAHNEITKKMHDEGMIDYASGDKKVQELVADRGGRNRFNYDFLENAEKNFSDKQRAFDTGKELYGNQSMKKLNGKTASELIDSYNSLSGDDQAEIREHLQKLQYKYTQNDEADKAATVAQFFGLFNKDQNSFINQKDTSIARQIGKTAASGGFVGDLAKTPENIIAQGAEMLGDKNAKKRTRISQYNHDIDNSNTGGVGVANKGFEAAANIGLNATGVGKAKILVDQVGGWIGAVDKAEAEKVLDYDENGKPTIRNKNFDEKLGTYGGQTLNTVLAGLNLKGIGPNMGSLDGLNKAGIAKELGKYYAKEIPYAAGTGYLNANLQHMANGGKFGEADMGQIAGEVFQDVVLDTGMDLRGSIANKSRSNSLKDLHHDVRNVLAKKTPEGNVNISKLHLDQMGFNKDELVGKFTGDTRKRMSDRAFKVLQEQRVNNPYATNDGGEISLTNKGNKKYISTKSPETDAEFSAKMRSAPRIDEIIGSSSYSHSAVDSKNHGIAPEGFDYRNSNFRYGGNDFETILNVAKSDSRGDTLYGGLTKEKNHSGGLNAAPGELVLPGPNDSHSSNISQNTKKVNGDYEYSDDIRLKQDSPRKNAQFELLQKTNPMLDDYHTGIRSAEDIRKFEDNFGDDESFGYPDFTKKDAQAIDPNGKIRVYSSKDINTGDFVTPSKMMAQDYAGGAEPNSKLVNVNDVAWINGDEGNYLPVSQDLKYKIQSETNQLTTKLDELKSRHQNLTGDDDLVFNIFKDEIQKNALGYFDPKTNKINLNDLTTDTLNHEIGHKIFSRVPMEQKADLINEIRSTFGDEALISKYGKDYGDDINILAEERLADGFNEYYQGKLNGEDSVRLGTRLGIPPKVLAYYDRMIEAIKSVFGVADELKKFYAEIETGKFAENNTSSKQNIPTSLQDSLAYKLNPTEAQNAIGRFNMVKNGWRRKVDMAKLSPESAAKYSQSTGLLVNDGAKLVLTNSTVRHLDNSGHLGRPGNYGRVDSNPLTDADIANIPEVFKSPDLIEHLGKGRLGERLRVYKEINNNHTMIVDLEASGNEFNIVTYYNKNKSLRNTQALSPEGVAELNPLRPRPKRSSGAYNESILQNADEVKYKRKTKKQQTLKEFLERNPNLKVRGFVDNILKNDPNPPAEFLESIKGKTYSPRKNAELWRAAIEDVARDPAKAQQDVQTLNTDKAIARRSAFVRSKRRRDCRTRPKRARRIAKGGEWVWRKGRGFK